LTVATQVQRLIPVAQFFSWLRRIGHLKVNPAADMTMPRPDRRLPESTLSAIEMAAVLSAPVVSKPLGCATGPSGGVLLLRLAAQ